MTGIQGAATFGFSDLDLAVAVESGLQVRDQKIFRVGTFTSMNRQTRVWTADDLDLAVENFYKLRDSNIVPNVPLREDHTQSIKDVVGYITAVRRFGDFLFADWEFVSEADKTKWDTKKWRNRSIEIGAYVANDGTKYDPVVLGLAFVDHPAVEGLYRIANSGEDMTTDTKTPDPKASDAPADPPATPPADPPATPPPATPPATPPAEPAPPQAQTPEPVGAHGNAQFQVQSFRLDGVEVADHARVQAHITELETFRTESIDSARAAFVDGLVEQKVITGPQGVAFHGLVKTMDPGQFTAFKAGFEGMAPANLFGKHDLGDGGTPPADAKTDRISVLQGIVANHRATGTSEEDLKTKPSFIELQTLQSSK